MKHPHIHYEDYVFILADDGLFSTTIEVQHTEHESRRTFHRYDVEYTAPWRDYNGAFDLFRFVGDHFHDMTAALCTEAEEQHS